MISNINDKIEKLENSEPSFYSFGSSVEDKKYFRYSYDDTAKSVSYEINYEWK